MKGLRQVAKKLFLVSFPYYQKFGIHLTPVHFYMPIPDTRLLSDETFGKRSELVGMDMREGEQIALLGVLTKMYKKEYDQFPLGPSSVPWQYWVNNDGISSVDGEVLYCMVRHFKPKRIVEIGSGKSTYNIAQAVRKNYQENSVAQCKATAIDPFPNPVVIQGFPGFAGVVRKRVQDVPLDVFEELGENDILFIDSSHVLAVGSDVHYEFLEIIPRLKKGVIVHVHDIFFPAEYPRDWIMKQCHFWTEQYLLQAFLAFNDAFQVMLCASFIHHRNPSLLRDSFQSYDPETRRPGSFWMRRVK